ncbi:hypothetical protein D9619_004140 [Psilocybe cf. subviscida]|uniref:MICOS complex subunit MIC60 n=1 Tax=Psilocybe cf. subviscida TaxID=2480587 RepID=A0A8H5BQ22_9AGAR|nr:hypothetical protein D9619_004140 [Psilocybe cf. subviscida]
MYRALPVSRQVASASSRQCVQVVKRRLTTEASALPKKKNIVRKIVLTTGAATATFYIGSTFVAFNNQDYYDLFTEHVPLGQSMIVFAEGRGWDNITAQDVIKGTSSAAMTSYRFVNDLINGQLSASQAIDKGASKVEKGASAVEQKASEVKTAAIKIVKQTKDKVGPSVEEAKKAVKGATEKVVEKVEGAPKAVVEKVEAQYDDLVQRAEAAIAGRPYEPKPAVVEEVPVASGSVYSAPLPLGFEPPPGYSRPAPPKPAVGEGAKAPEPAPVVLPSLVEAVTTDSEPIITHLAGTIDNLAAFLKADPKAAAQAGDVLETAKGDLAALVDRIEAAKQHERSALEAKLDEQTHEYSLKLLELEMEAQDKLDSQETGYKQLFEHERGKLIQAYREKLNHELQVQTELINERLKEEVIAQGIELQRRWIREIKVRVEQERGGRLAKLDELSANIKRLEQIALDNSEHLDENIRVHALWSAIRALGNNAVGAPVRKPFREELRILRHIAAAKEDPVVSVVLDSLESTDIPDVGVEPFADLATWFTNEVAPKVSQVALVPDENAGVLSFLASKALSGIRFKRQGLVPGDDVLSVLARAEYYLNEKNLDSAARELNQLRGPAKMLLHDWLEAARRRLEVQQALEVVHTQATLASLLVV